MRLFFAWRPEPTANRLAALIAAGFVLLALVYAAVTPPFEAPDEGSHFLYTHNLLETGQLPRLEDRATVFASKSVQRHHPPLYYVVGAALIAGTDRADVDAYLQFNPYATIGQSQVNNQNVFLHPLRTDGDTARAIWLLRLYSIALATGTLWCIYRAVTLAYERASTGLLAMALVAVMPSFIFISASINNDNLVTLCFAAGVWWLLRMWRRETVTRRDAVLLGVILSAAALSKISGLMLVGIAYPTLIVAWWAGRLSRQELVRALGISLALLALLAGWWYARNWSLYGDPLALEATDRIWGRGEVTWTPTMISREARGTWESLWMVLGNLNIHGPRWLYTYIAVICVIGAAGALWSMVRQPRQRLPSLFLSVVWLFVVGALIMATRQINVSQGRILFPGLAALAGLLVNGWLAWGGRRLAGLLIMPLAVIALSAPFTALRPAWLPPQPVSRLPDDAQPVDAYAATLHLLAYELLDQQVAPGATVGIDLYLQGQHSANPVLFVKALDPLTLASVGGVDTYPGMALTATFDPHQIYRVRVRFTVDQALDAPRQLALAVGWRIPADDMAAARTLAWAGADGTPLASLLLAGPTLVDPAYQAPMSAQVAEVTFGDAIRLTGYTLSAARLAPGEALHVTLLWEALAALDDDWTVTLALDGLDGAQHDGMIAGYPTSAWVRGVTVADPRVIQIPADAAPGTYYLRVGWYRLADGVRLPVQDPSARDNLYFIPLAVEVR